MNTKDTGGPAFPYLETGDCGQREGMTLRDYFAAKAMQGLIGKYSHQNDIARNAYAIADAMLGARK